MKYLDEEGIRRTFADFLIKVRDYSEEEAMFAVRRFPDVYEFPWLEEKFVEDGVMIDGKSYMKMCNYTNFSMCGFDIPHFLFYTYYLEDDIQGGTVGEYMDAKKLFQVTRLRKKDFPNWIIDEPNSLNIK